jgi:nucleoside-diphosphate-sugar epimerase
METVLVTGATGRIGPHVLAALADAGVETVGFSRSGGSAADVDLRGDATDPGDVYGALARTEPDGVVHLGTLSGPEHDPGHVVFESNALSPYVVCEAAAAVGVERVVSASSLAALGTGFQPEPVRLSYLPLDEDHPLTAHDPYGLGKRAGEVAAGGVARRRGAPSVVSLRFPYVVDGATAAAWRGADRSLAGLRDSGDFETARDTLFSYLRSSDAARAVRRALAADGVDGHEACFVVAADTTTTTPTPTLVERVYPDVPTRTALDAGSRASLISTARARDLLDWEPRASWLDDPDEPGSGTGAGED